MRFVLNTSVHIHHPNNVRVLYEKPNPDFPYFTVYLESKEGIGEIAINLSPDEFRDLLGKMIQVYGGLQKVNA